MARHVEANRRSLPLHDWPLCDQQAWAIAIANGDLLDGRGPAAHWAPQTKLTNIQNYGRWLGWLKWSGRLESSETSASRVTMLNVRAYNQHLAVLVVPYSRLSLLVGLKVTIAALAPDHSWRWLQDLCNKVQRRARPKFDKRPRMRPTGEIYAKSLRELHAIVSGQLDLHKAVAYRDTLLLALLAARPLRTRNASEIELGHHLIRIDDRWLLAFAGSEVKNRQPLEFFLPDDLGPWLDHYISDIRPMFPGALASRRLWLNQYGGHVGPRFIYYRVSNVTKRLLGVAINPHLLRDCAVSSLAMVSPEMARAGAALLGHRHFSTTERYYIQANELEASRRLNAILAEIKHDLEE